MCMMFLYDQDYTKYEKGTLINTRHNKLGETTINLLCRIISNYDNIIIEIEYEKNELSVKMTFHISLMLVERATSPHGQV